MSLSVIYLPFHPPVKLSFERPSLLNPPEPLGLPDAPDPPSPSLCQSLSSHLASIFLDYTCLQGPLIRRGCRVVYAFSLTGNILRLPQKPASFWPPSLMSSLHPLAPPVIITNGLGWLRSLRKSRTTAQIRRNHRRQTQLVHRNQSLGNNWLPPDWRTEMKVRTSGTKAGVVDKFYYEPVTNRKFRSKTEVLYYLDNGTPKKKGTKKAESEHFEGGESSMRQTKSKNKTNEPPAPTPPPPRPLNFDFHNVPEKVIWTGTSSSEEAWLPYIGDYKIQESVCRDWDRAFTFVTAQNNGKFPV